MTGRRQTCPVPLGLGPLALELGGFRTPISRAKGLGLVVLTSDDGMSKLAPQLVIGEPFSRDEKLCYRELSEYDKLHSTQLAEQLAI